MSGTGDFDDDQKGNTTEPAPSASTGHVFAEVAGATAMPEEIPDGIDQGGNTSEADASEADAPDEH